MADNDSDTFDASNGVITASGEVRALPPGPLPRRDNAQVPQLQVQRTTPSLATAEVRPPTASRVRPTATTVAPRVKPVNQVALAKQQGKTANNVALPTASQANPAAKTRNTLKQRSFTSVDGKTYAITTETIVNNKRVADPARVHKMLILALREIGLGGNPLVVLDAFGCVLEDANGQTLLPVTTTEDIGQLMDALFSNEPE